LLREPFGRPAGLPDCPGFQGINPRCLCFRTVESLSAASAFDMVNQTHFVVRLSASPNVRSQSFTIAADSLGITWQLLGLIVKPTLDFISTSREF